MNALDPALLEVILGPKRCRRLVQQLRKVYARVQKDFPEQFTEVVSYWDVPREWWLQFVQRPAGAQAITKWGAFDPYPGGALYPREGPPRRRRALFFAVGRPPNGDARDQRTTA